MLPGLQRLLWRGGRVRARRDRLLQALCARLFVWLLARVNTATKEYSDWRQYQDTCPTKCPARDMMVCARCQHGVHRTFMSRCYMRMYQCSDPEESLELVAHQPCVASAPYLGELPRAETGLSFPSDGDLVLQFLDDRRKRDG